MANILFQTRGVVRMNQFLFTAGSVFPVPQLSALLRLCGHLNFHFLGHSKFLWFLKYRIITNIMAIVVMYGHAVSMLSSSHIYALCMSYLNSKRRCHSKIDTVLNAS
jgi:hypothetical protein